MTTSPILRLLACTAAACSLLCSCGDGESYAKLLDQEDRSVNRFLADQKVIDAIPEDSDFETGPDAPYYVLDADGGIYMQVLDKGDMDDRAQTDQEIYFRYMGATLMDYTSMDELSWSGNASELTAGNFSFRFENFTIPSSYQWGTGIQQPLHYLGIGCRVNLVVKSVSGFVELQSQCNPILFNVTYQKSALTTQE